MSDPSSRIKRILRMTEASSDNDPLINSAVRQAIENEVEKRLGEREKAESQPGAVEPDAVRDHDREVVLMSSIKTALEKANQSPTTVDLTYATAKEKSPDGTRRAVRIVQARIDIGSVITSIDQLCSKAGIAISIAGKACWNCVVWLSKRSPTQLKGRTAKSRDFGSRPMKSVSVQGQEVSVPFGEVEIGTREEGPNDHSEEEHRS